MSFGYRSTSEDSCGSFKGLYLSLKEVDWGSNSSDIPPLAGVIGALESLGLNLEPLNESTSRRDRLSPKALEDNNAKYNMMYHKGGHEEDTPRFYWGLGKNLGRFNFEGRGWKSHILKSQKK